MKKVLILASVPSMIGQFNMHNIKILKSLGYIVEIACNFDDRTVWTDERVNKFIEDLDNDNINRYQVDFSRSSYNFIKHLHSYRQVKKLLTKNKYSFIHCHSPIGGVIGRIAAHKTNTKVIYTAHGFHFFKGAPLINWMIFYPVEKICSYMTDVLITINKEDYALAQKKMKARRVEYIPGVGVDTEKFSDHKENHIREELGISEDARILLSVGELNENKNHERVIRALAGILDFKENCYYLIAGQGDLKEHMEAVIEGCGLTGRVNLLGFRSDIAALYDTADVFVFPSHREGLSVALMEAMASGLPVVCSDIRGNTDLITEEKYRFNPADVDDIRVKIQNVLMFSSDDLKTIGSDNLNTMRLFNTETVVEAVESVYGFFFPNRGRLK